ncbi:MAG: DoxX family protein [Acidobacteria bacterium]|nr:DoxX family protein [Acidobacteriota bacterium]
MTRFLEPYSECIHDTVRIVAGYCFMLHGLQKMFGLFGGQQVEIASLLGLAGIIETVGGALIIVGLFTKPVAFIASGQMAVAYFIGHVAREGQFFLPLVNRGESAVLFCFLFLYLASAGPGAWSLDARLGRK